MSEIPAAVERLLQAWKHESFVHRLYPDEPISERLKAALNDLERAEQTDHLDSIREEAKEELFWKSLDNLDFGSLD